MEDPTLTQRLHDAGADFARVWKNPSPPFGVFF